MFKSGQSGSPGITKMARATRHAGVPVLLMGEPTPLSEWVLPYRSHVSDRKAQVLPGSETKWSWNDIQRFPLSPWSMVVWWTWLATVDSTIINRRTTTSGMQTNQHEQPCNEVEDVDSQSSTDLATTASTAMQLRCDDFDATSNRRFVDPNVATMTRWWHLNGRIWRRALVDVSTQRRMESQGRDFDVLRSRVGPRFLWWGWM